jgi:AraC family transcriptional regulator
MRPLPGPRTRAAAVGRDVEREIARLSGARAVRIVDRGGSVVAEHSHDWPILSLFVTGDYLKVSELGATRIRAPSAILHAPGGAHANLVGSVGAEQLDIEFDPAWAGLDRAALLPVRCWIGGTVAASGQRLARLWRSGRASETMLALATRQFLEQALRAAPERTPPWLDRVAALLRAESPPPTTAIAARLGMNPGWLAQAYRRAVGEGIGDTLRRRRVESAAAMLRAREAPHAQIAAAAGFCDQSHMIRAFRAVLGRTPTQIVAEIGASA